MIFWEDKRILVTGAAGFLGSHLVKKLKERAWLAGRDGF